jgi:hypothetical protein
MPVKTYKVAWMESDDTSKLYSRFFDTESQAREYLNSLEGGKEGLLFRKLADTETYYEWQLLNTPSARKLKLANFVFSPIFMIPLILGVILFLLLRKNNGLPKVIG